MGSGPVTRMNGVTTERCDWGAIKWLMNQELNAGAQQTFGIVFILPGSQNPSHVHPNCEELLFVLSGQCEHAVADEVYPMQSGDTVRIPAGVAHNARNTGWEPFRAIISFSSGDRKTVFLDAGS